MKNKLIITAVLLTLVVLLLGGCFGGSSGCGGSAGPLPKPKPSDAGAEMHYITGSCTAALEGDKIVVSGTSDIEDGTNGTISLLAANGRTIEEQKITKNGDNLQHTFDISDSWHTKQVYAFISFGPKEGDSQSKAIREKYGKNFEYVEGDEGTIVWNSENVTVVFSSELIEIP